MGEAAVTVLRSGGPSGAAGASHRRDGGAGGGGGDCVLTHGSCAAVTALLLHAAREAHFTLLVAEGKAEGEGHRTAAALLRSQRLSSWSNRACA